MSLFAFRRQSIASAITASLLASAPCAVMAASSEAAADSVTTIVIREVIPADLSDTPGAASRLTEEELALLRPYTLHDAFAFIPGVKTIDDDVLGRRSAIGIRGAPARRSRKTLLLEDGTPINFSAYLDPSSHYTPPMERLETVDVLKGAGHVLYGPLNNHGIINFRNKQPTATPETTVELAAGNLGTFKRHLMHRRTDGNLGLVMAYTGAHADGSFDVEGFQYDDIYLSAQWTASDRHELGMSITHMRERSNYDESNLTPQEYAVAPRRKLGRFAQEYNTFALNYTKVDFAHDFDISDTLSLSTRLFGISADRPRFTVDPEEIDVDALPVIELEDPDNLFVPGVQGVMVSRDRHYRTYGAETRMQARSLISGDLEHNLQWGLRYERHFLDDMRSEGAPGQLLSESDRGPRTRDEAYQASAVSAFIQDAVRVGDLLITPGLRVEEYKVNKVRQAIAGDPGPHDPIQEDSNFLALPSISLLYDGFGDTTQLFANAARGYTPAFARTAEGFPLEPETGINTQLGIRSQLAGVSLEAAVFYNRMKDTIVQLPFTVNDMNIHLNSADSMSRGLDIGARIDSASFGNSRLNFFAQAAWNYTEAEFTEDYQNSGIEGNRVPEVPLHAGSVTFGMDHASGWHASATVSHFGSFYTDPLNTRALTLADEDREPVQAGDELEIREPAVLGRVPEHTLVSARLSYTPPGRGLSFWLQARNLTDKLYISDLENGIRPGAERTVTGGVRLQF